MIPTALNRFPACQFTTVLEFNCLLCAELIFKYFTLYHAQSTKHDCVVQQRGLEHSFCPPVSACLTKHNLQWLKCTYLFRVLDPKWPKLRLLDGPTTVAVTQEKFPGTYLLATACLLNVGGTTWTSVLCNCLLLALKDCPAVTLDILHGGTVQYRATSDPMIHLTRQAGSINAKWLQSHQHAKAKLHSFHHNDSIRPNSLLVSKLSPRLMPFFGLS